MFSTNRWLSDCSLNIHLDPIKRIDAHPSKIKNELRIFWFVFAFDNYIQRREILFLSFFFRNIQCIFSANFSRLVPFHTWKAIYVNRIELKINSFYVKRIKQDQKSCHLLLSEKENHGTNEIPFRWKFIRFKERIRELKAWKGHLNRLQRA